MPYNKGLLRKKLYDCFFTWSLEITWQMKSDVSPYPRHPQQPNLTMCWIISTALLWQSLVALWSRAHMGSGDKFSTLYYFSVKPLVKKQGRVEVFYEGLLTTKSHVPSILSREDMLQINMLYLHCHNPWPRIFIR